MLFREREYPRLHSFTLAPARSAGVRDPHSWTVFIRKPSTKDTTIMNAPAALALRSPGVLPGERSAKHVLEAPRRCYPTIPS